MQKQNADHSKQRDVLHEVRPFCSVGRVGRLPDCSGSVTNGKVLGQQGDSDINIAGSFIARVMLRDGFIPKAAIGPFWKPTSP